ncbi:winged helix-turn-helix transcriptional regulator [Viridibacillus arvi]|uniref:winged helix-turn-helix transcriptional regulator n=1 Tax=Viridibacillus arvi TaxID=263475 RepID=UPI003D290C10
MFEKTAKLKEVKELEGDGLIQREIFDKLPINVENRLTDLGEQLLPVLVLFKTEIKELSVGHLTPFE